MNNGKNLVHDILNANKHIFDAIHDYAYGTESASLGPFYHFCWKMKFPLPFAICIEGRSRLRVQFADGIFWRKYTKYEEW